MRISLLLVVLLFAAAPLARAQSQADMNETACKAAKKADAELNAVYNAILKNVKDDKEFIAKLKVAQRAWVAFRDAELDARYPAKDKAMAYGTMFNLCYCNALAALTQKRTAELAPWRDGVPEGDACVGSYPVK